MTTLVVLASTLTFTSHPMESLKEPESTSTYWRNLDSSTRSVEWGVYNTQNIYASFLLVFCLHVASRRKELSHLLSFVGWNEQERPGKAQACQRPNKIQLPHQGQSRSHDYSYCSITPTFTLKWYVMFHNTWPSKILCIVSEFSHIIMSVPHIHTLNILPSFLQHL